ncbi:TPA: crossover junction endodeoxyribonuclease RuvC [Candidatus Shapirobacteria bacterium]|uniref:Crossover junction endodeoxyribonuclease RuvC n=1 Tax=Candidatus Shapirobacteria bacterium GW2011_GWE2_38_30 TaxID=1618490 RepID=A0A0G0JRH4_9BACT|nr:MAG: Crossover junction endodeoxyribonuclease RuvC [Candidatus Shapirobacteria bacterium GW2011_GWE2_38_30]OGL56575.1 MAG: crossover junction endodeoxyribonuclease RuvC [Candidatus Shapirobacteria bacterium RIFOXYA1_FULL_39_17]HCU54942.1 crossover junction endodeoxyribonuclease RuvC [Candidatus Shapirobacteria bacterium]
MILGIDPGLANTGFAVLETSDSGQENEIKLKECGVWLTKSSESDVERLKEIYMELEKIIKKYGVERIAVESLFFAKNAKSALPVAEAIGVIKVCGANLGLEVVTYTPLQIKMALVGYGRAEKFQVEEMVRASLNLEKPISPSHAADAVAAALTDLFTMKI